MTQSPEKETEAASVVDAVRAQSRRVLDTYEIDPGLILEHANGERRIFQGGYGDRQLYELVQNGADEMRETPGGEIRVVLTTSHLYVANEGKPFTTRGVETILRMGVSYKRGGQIGRFGVGVKSVLAISDSPQFFSASGSFGFDRSWSEEMIRAVQPDVAEIPVLRMAQPLDGTKSAANDPVLGELLKWATTVVRLPLKPGAASRLAKDIEQFPLQFALFSPHVGTVILEDRRQARPQPYRRELFARVEGDRHTIESSATGQQDVTERWRVFTRSHTPSADAHTDAGELHDRPVIDVSWAVPAQNLNKRGEFWAYFPTHYATTLRGIVNAPWKTSEDRQNLFHGNKFNEELIKVLAELIVDSLPDLAPSEDPAAYLALLPARGREAPQWADKMITDAVYEVASARPSLPDQSGRLHRPQELHVHPKDLAESWLALWAGHAGRPHDWCHHSIERGDRRSRAEMIFERATVRPSSIREWLEALVSDGSAGASQRAIKIIAEMKRASSPLLADALTARVVLTEAHGLVAPKGDKIFRRTDDALGDDLPYVAEEVLTDFDVIQALETLGIHESDAKGRFQAVVEQGFQGYSDNQWTEFWRFTQRVGPNDTIGVLHEHGYIGSGEVKIRTVSGQFRQVRNCLLPGPVVPGDGSRDGAVAVDLVFHVHDRPILEALGLSAAPAISVDPRGTGWFEEYAVEAHKVFLKSLPAETPRPALASMRLHGASPAGPLGMLLDLSEEGRAAFVKALPPGGLVASWTMQAGAKTSTERTIISPLVWMVRSHGRVPTSRGIRVPDKAVGPALAAYKDLLPVAQIGDGLSSALRLADTLAGVPTRIWRDLLVEVTEATEDALPGRVYALMLEAEAAFPDGFETRCRVGDEWTFRPDAEIAVTSDPIEYATLCRESVPALLVPSPEDASKMVAAWGMRRYEDLVEIEVRYTADGEKTLLVEEFPYLKVLRGAKVTGWSLVRCTSLEQVMRSPRGLSSDPLAHALQEQDRLVLVAHADDDLAALIAVDEALDLRLGRDNCQGVLDHRARQRDDEQIKIARKAQRVEDKLAALLDVETLKSRLPNGLLENVEAEEGEVTSDRVAQLAANAYGPETLRVYKEELTAKYNEGVGNFRGEAGSRRFVADLGFPEEYAGQRSVQPPEVEQVDGPTFFPSLHEYQERIVTRMVTLLRQSIPGRAMLTLPTGAGKTRVAAEAVIRVLRDSDLKGPILWIAPSRELCEQAVQSWKFLWKTVGPENRLTVSRLWSSNQATPVASNPHLVVATEDKLTNCLTTPEYAWLRSPALVIVDEAHGSLTPQYTDIMKTLGLTYSITERPLIGLTATPFRNTNVEETRRLAERYGKKRLDEGVFDGDPYEVLQSLGMLARVEHRVLPGTEITLNASELAEMQGFRGARSLPTTVEEQLARNLERNRLLVDEVAALPEDWPVLLFAVSVDHARLLTAKFRDRGISSVAIDGTTPTADRKARIEDFRDGKIRVLTNYGVLAQGFDAPATRAVVVARPTYSTNVYQQMIGRGLRGPKNGGTDVCLILNVEDNVTNYGEELAFTGFEYLWGQR